MRTMTLIAALGLLLTACGGGGGSGGGSGSGSQVAQTIDTPISKVGLRTFTAGCSDFLAYAADALTEQYLNRYTCYASFGACPVFAGAPVAENTAADGAGSGNTPTAAAPDRVSSTNTQEAGVDEADVVKADAAGNLYVLTGRRLNILPAFPPAGLESRALATLTLASDSESFHASDFFLDETTRRLVVLATRYGARAQTVSVIVDVGNPAAPVEVSRLFLDGYGLEARRVGNRVHRVSRYDVPSPPWFNSSGDPLASQRESHQQALSRGDQAEADRIKAEVRAEIGRRVTSAGANALLPRLSASGGSESALACSDIAHPEVTTGMGLALIDSFSTQGTQRAVSGIVNNAGLVYGSTQNLYLAQSSFGWFFSRNQTEQTAIYRLQLSDTGAAQYRGAGLVDGSVIGRYAFSEFNGALRVASTETNFDGQRTTTKNGVTVLDASGGDMAKLGAVENLAPGERIQGVRFVGDRGYVVTFRQVDPLFALDLSNPAAPRVTDELKIPGFSSYLLPLGGNHLLTIGRAGDEERLNGQVAAQLFDVQNPANIRQMASLSPAAGGNNYSYSAAEYDPHAFSYFSDSAGAPVPGTLSVPLHSYDQNSGSGFTGFLVLRVDPSAAQPLREIGRVSHAGFLQPGAGCGSSGGGSSGGSSGGGNSSSPAPCASAYYAADPRRSVFMQDANGRYLFTVSSLGVIASNAATPSTELGRHALPADSSGCCVYAAGAAF